MIVFRDSRVGAAGVLCANPGSPAYSHNRDVNASVWLPTDDGIEPFGRDAILPWKRL